MVERRSIQDGSECFFLQTRIRIEIHAQAVIRTPHHALDFCFSRTIFPTALLENLDSGWPAIMGGEMLLRCLPAFASHDYLDIYRNRSTFDVHYAPITRATCCSLSSRRLACEACVLQT